MAIIGFGLEVKASGEDEGQSLQYLHDVCFDIRRPTIEPPDIELLVTARICRASKAANLHRIHSPTS